MRVQVLGEALALTGTGAGTAFNAAATPFLPSRECVAEIILTGATTTAEVKIQGSLDNSSWTDLLTANVASPVKKLTVTVYPYMRVNRTVVGGAGTGAAYLLADN